ncbi:MAG: HlyD family efflux transporter periplasmic adaptor subunit [Chlamydiae bacterium]|nr:HlyD family efflux transporter periplasmic adaptor subunit [Chlamydiota bacterium]
MSETPETPPNKRRYFAIWIGVSLFFLAVGLGFCAYYFIWGQYHETTDDAYVNGNMIIVKPFEAGIIVSILADNAQLVEKGQTLIELNRHEFEIALQRAKANLGESIRDVVQMFYKVEELKAKIDVAKAELTRAQLDYEHRLNLVTDGSVSREDFEHSETTLSAAIAALQMVEKEFDEAHSFVQNTTPFTHPKVEMAKAEVRRAFLALERTQILAPASGIISQRKAQVGQWVNPGEQLLALIPTDQIWVDANYREVELKNIRVGQPVELTADMYGRGIRFSGKVVGLNAGTGAVFSVLPPQNATGNWIKIIQRVPVKISLHPEDVKMHPLVLGLSMTTRVDTHDRNGAKLAVMGDVKPVYATDVYTDELKGVEEMIEGIFLANASEESFASK